MDDKKRPMPQFLVVETKFLRKFKDMGFDVFLIVFY